MELTGSINFIQCLPESSKWSGLSFDAYADIPIELSLKNMDPKCGSYEFILLRSLSYPESSFVFVQNPSQDKVTIEVTSALVETIGSSTYTVWLRARNETEPNLFVDNVIVINVICEV